MAGRASKQYKYTHCRKPKYGTLITGRAQGSAINALIMDMISRRVLLNANASILQYNANAISGTWDTL